MMIHHQLLPMQPQMPLLLHINHTSEIFLELHRSFHGILQVGKCASGKAGSIPESVSLWEPPLLPMEAEAPKADFFSGGAEV